MKTECLITVALLVALASASTDINSWYRKASICLQDDQKVFCSYTKTCVSLESACPSMEDKMICPYSTAFCYETGRCESTNGYRCYSVHCGTDQTFCHTNSSCMDHQTDVCSDAHPINLRRHEEAAMARKRDSNDCDSIQRIYDHCLTLDDKCIALQGSLDQSEEDPDFPEDHCPIGTRFCPLSAECILPETKCNFPRANIHIDSHDGHMIAICPLGQYFCIGTQECLPHSQDCTAEAAVRNLTRESTNGCGGGRIFCPFTRECVQDTHNCTKETFRLAIEKDQCTANQTLCLGSRTCVTSGSSCDPQSTAESIFSTDCKDDEKFCIRSLQCIKQTEDCAIQPLVAYDDMQDPTGWKTTCSLRHVVCPWAFRNSFVKDKACPKVIPTTASPTGIVNIFENVTTSSMCIIKKDQPIKTCFGSAPVSYIAIVTVTNQHGNLKVQSVNQDEITLDASEVVHGNALVVNRNAILEFVPSSPLFHGVVLIKYVSLLEGTHGQRVNIDSELETKFLALIIMPQILSPLLLSTNQNTLDINEDETQPRGFQVSHAVMLLKRKQKATALPDYLKAKISSEDYTSYHLVLDEIKSTQYKIVIGKLQGTQDGKWQIKRSRVVRESPMQPSVGIQPPMQSDWWDELPRTVGMTKPFEVHGSSVLRFIPHPDVFGEFSLCFYAQSTSIKYTQCNGKTCIDRQMAFTLPCVKFTVNVTNINDPPVLAAAEVNLPSVPFDLEENNGFEVSEVTTVNIHNIRRNSRTESQRFQTSNQFVSDADGTVNGIAIVDSPASSLGHWEYQIPGTAWRSLLIRNLRIAAEITMDALMLPSNAQLKFVPIATQTFWSCRQAMYAASFTFLAWDASDGRAPGANRIMVRSTTVGGISSSWAKGVVTRRGCDNKPESMKVFDVCGVCGGDGKSCKRCDQSTNSDAVIDECGQCTRGSTGRQYNYNKDCMGQCGGRARLDDCGVCRPETYTESHKDCHGTCFGSAILNRCNRCILGETGLTANAGMDECGVCNGDGSTCNECIQPDVICNFELITFTPDIVPSKKEFMFIARGMGDAKGKTAKCHVTETTTALRTELGVSEAISSQDDLAISFEILVASLNVGVYNVTCTLGEDLKEYAFKVTRLLRVYDNDLIVINDAVPNVVYTDEPSTVVLKGTGFMDSSELKCANENEKELLEAIYLNSSAIECKFSGAKVDPSVSIRTSAFEHNFDGGITRQTFKLGRQCKRPKVKKVRTHRNNRVVRFHLDKEAEMPENVSPNDCRSFLTEESLNKFPNAKCRMRTPKQLQISVRGLRGNSLRRKFQLKPVAWRCRSTVPTVGAGDNNDLNVTYNETDVANHPVAVIEGPDYFRTCGPLRLSGIRSTGRYGRGLIYEWTLEEIMDEITKITKASGSGAIFFINGDKLTANYVYKATLCVKNRFDKTNCTHKTYSVDNTKPIAIDIGKRHVTVEAGRHFHKRARLFAAQCNGDHPKVSCIWGITPHAEMKDENTRMVRIVKGTMKANMQYNLTVTCSANGDAATEVMSYVVIDTIPSKIKAKIKDGRIKAVVCDGTLELDGGESFDPDQSTETEIFLWECLNQNNTICMKNNINNQGERDALELPSNKQLILPIAGNLECNRRYTFTLFYGKGSRNDTKNITVFVKNVDETRIHLYQRKEKPCSKSEYYGIAAKIFTTDDTVIEWGFKTDEEIGVAEWRDFAADLESNLPTQSIALKNGKNKKHKTMYRFFKREAFVPDTNYRLFVNANTNNVTYSNELDINLNGGPSEGDFDVVPNTGIAMTTKFSLSAEVGWEDDDKPFSYIFGYLLHVDGDTVEIPLTKPSDEPILEDIVLPTGSGTNQSLTLFVYVVDSNGECTQVLTSIIVTSPETITNEIVGDTNVVADQFVDDEKYEDSLGLVVTLLRSLEAKQGDENSNLASVDFADEVTKRALEMMQLVKEKDQQDLRSTVLKSLVYSSLKDTDRSDQTSDTVALFMADLAQTVDFKATNVDMEYPTRGKRESEPRMPEIQRVLSQDWEPLRTEEVKNILLLFDQTIDTLDYDESSLAVKKNITASLVSLLRSISVHTIRNPTPLNVNSRHIALQTAFILFDDVDTQAITIKSTTNQHISVTLGPTLGAWYEEWNCNVEEIMVCTEAFVASAIVPSSLYSRDEFDRLVVVSPVIKLELLSPSSYATMETNHEEKDILITMPLDETLNLDTQKCAMWDEGEQKWSLSVCSLGGENSATVVCACPRLGTVSVVREKEEEVTEKNTDTVILIVPIPETPAPATLPPATTEETTQEQSTIPTTKPTTQVQQTSTAAALTRAEIEFSFQVDYDTYMQRHGENAFTSALKIAFYEVSEIPANTVEHIEYREGSIIVNVIFAASDNNAAFNITLSVEELQQIIDQGQFSIMLPDGTILTAIGNMPTASTLGTDDESSTFLAIPGIGILLAILGAYYFYRKKKMRAKVLPDDYKVDMKQMNVAKFPNNEFKKGRFAMADVA